MLFLDVCRTMEYMPCIKVRKNARRVRPKTDSILRKLAVLAQRNDFKKMEKISKYLEEMDSKNSNVFFHKENV